MFKGFKKKAKEKAQEKAAAKSESSSKRKEPQALHTESWAAAAPTNGAADVDHYPTETYQKPPRREPQAESEP